MTDFSKPVDQLEVEVPPEHAGQRIDSYLPRRFNWRSRQYFLGLLQDGTVHVNGRQVKKAYRVADGDRIAITLPAEYRTQFDYASIPLHILHEDDQLVVVNKSGDLAVQPTGHYIHRNLLNRLRYLYRDERGDTAADPCIVHRLDRETSGAIVFAKGRDAARQLAQQFANKGAHKIYRAIVHGTLPATGTIEAPLLATRDRHVVVDPSGKPARTHFEREAVGGGLSSVKLTLETGRQHQLRVHLAHLGHPIVSDDLYGLPADRTDAELPNRHMLHAAELELALPDGPRMRFCAPLAPDMLGLLDKRLGNAQKQHA